MMDPQRYAEWRRTHPPILGADLTTNRPPKDNLVRAVSPAALRRPDPVGVSVRADPDGGDGRTLFGHFTVFNEWTEINSMWEGQFLERIAPGAAKKTLREQTPKVLFQHGMDPQLGDRVIAAAPDVLREDEIGPYFEARLLDGLDPLVMEGLRAGVYGISFRFSVVREEWVDEPDASDLNPKGLPERTIKEMRVAEFGPVTFPAYPGADVGVRSMTDEVLIGRAATPTSRARLRAFLEALDARDNGNDRPQPDPEAADAPREPDEQPQPDQQVDAAANQAADELPGAETAPAPPADAGADQQDPADEADSSSAPADDRAGGTHPVNARRASKTTALYGQKHEEKSWRL